MRKRWSGKEIKRDRTSVFGISLAHVAEEAPVMGSHSKRSELSKSGSRGKIWGSVVLKEE